MTHWILRLLLIAIQVAQQITGIRTDASHDAGFATLVDDFFNYDLCEPPTHKDESGVGWTCYEPEDCAPGGVGSDVKLREKKDKIATCHALLAVQYHKSSGEDTFLRIVLQIQSNKAKIESGVRFFYSDVEQLSCKIDQSRVAIYEQTGRPYFGVDPTYSFAKKDTNMFMCEAKLILTKGKDNPQQLSNQEVGIMWEENGNFKEAIWSNGQFWADIKATPTCKLGDVAFENAKPEEKLESKHVNMDRNRFTCPAGYTMRMFDRSINHVDRTYTNLEYFYCDTQGRLFKFKTPGSAVDQKSRPVYMHCARKLCKQCTAPTCPANGNCPTVKIEDANFDSCAKLTCASVPNVFKFSGTIHEGEPVCENKKWSLSGNAITEAQCATAVKCADSASAVTVAKTEDVEMGDTEVICKDGGNMTYTADEQTILLSKVACNGLEGKWFEERVDPPGFVEYSSANELRCVGQEGAAAPSKGGLPLLEIGVGLAALALIVVVVILLICCCKKRKERESAQKHKLATKSTKSNENRSKESIEYIRADDENIENIPTRTVIERRVNNLVSQMDRLNAQILNIFRNKNLASARVITSIDIELCQIKERMDGITSQIMSLCGSVLFPDPIYAAWRVHLNNEQQAKLNVPYAQARQRAIQYRHALQGSSSSNE